MPLPPSAIAGFSAASAYDLHRPTYIPPAVSHLLTQLHLAHHSSAAILDLAAGTGKFTELLSARPEKYRIVAVEPHAAMLERLRAKKLPRVDVREGDAGSIPVRDRWADAVIVAQAFHWFANHQALAEIARTMKPGAKLGLVWNVEDYNQARNYTTKTKWESALREINWKYTQDDSPRYKDSAWAAAFEGQEIFGELGEKVFEVEIWLEKEDLWRRLGTLSNIANLSDGEKDDLREDFDQVLHEADDVVCNERDEIAVHYIVHVAWATKL